MKIVSNEIWAVRIQGDTDQVFVGNTLAQATDVAQLWIESEQLRGYLNSKVNLPKITSWNVELGQFFYTYTCDDCGLDKCGEILGEHESYDWFTHRLLTSVTAK